jgi:hypothetical protein
MLNLSVEVIEIVFWVKNNVEMSYIFEAKVVYSFNDYQRLR